MSTEKTIPPECLKARALFEQAVGGDNAARKNIRGHLARCSLCQVAWAELQDVETRLQEFASVAEAECGKNSLSASVMAAIQKQEKATVVPQNHRRRWLLAVCLIVGISLGFMLRARPLEVSEKTPPSVKKSDDPSIPPELSAGEMEAMVFPELSSKSSELHISYKSSLFEEEKSETAVSSVARAYLVKTTLNQVYATADSEKNVLDLYQPVGAKNVPMVIFISGGNWMEGDRSWYAQIGKEFAGNGMLCAVIGYRFSPKVKYPAHLEDCAEALSWLLKNGAAYGGDPTRVILAGHAAGGHLAALLALDKKRQVARQVPPGVVCGVVSLSGIYNLMPYLLASAGRDLIGKVFSLDENVLREASPFHRIEPGAPPFLLLTGEREDRMTRFQVEQFSAGLKREKVPVKTVVISGRGQADLISKFGSAEDKAAEVVLEFCRSYTAPEKTEKTK